LWVDVGYDRSIQNATYRVSQVEAVIRVLFEGPYREAAGKIILDAKFFHRVRRMLQIDRQHGMNIGSKLSEHLMAFFDEVPEGKGIRFALRHKRLLIWSLPVSF